MSIAVQLRKRRMQLGISQGELSERCKIQPSNISHYEGGEREPSVGNLIVLADALGCSLDALAGRPSDYEDAFRRGYFQCREDMKNATKAALVKKHAA